MLLTDCRHLQLTVCAEVGEGGMPHKVS